jgi:hypothetical protein
MRWQPTCKYKKTPFIGCMVLKISQSATNFCNALEQAVLFVPIRFYSYLFVVYPWKMFLIPHENVYIYKLKKIKPLEW